MKKIIFAMVLLFLPVSAQAAGYGAYGVYGYQGRFSPYGHNGYNIYVVPQQPIIAPFPQLPSSANELNQLSQGVLMMEQARMLQAQRQQMMQQQQQPLPDPRAVAHVQSVLTKLGYSPGPIDGRIGPRTEQAFFDYVRNTGKSPEEALLTLLRESMAK